MAVEYLDASIANEGLHAEAPIPGWMNNPSASDEEYQPDMEPPHINDYAAFKKHKHYRQYFRPYRYQAFPAWVYHAKQEPRLIAKYRDGKIDIEAGQAEVLALGSEWSPKPIKPRIDMTGKSLPVKNDTQRLTETLVENITKIAPSANGAVDPNMIAAIVAAVMAAQQPVVAAKPVEHAADELMPDTSPVAVTDAPADVERAALIELAEKEGVKIDNRWGNDRIKKALGLE